MVELQVLLEAVDQEEVLALAAEEDLLEVEVEEELDKKLDKKYKIKV